MQNITLTIDGMTCEGCVKSVERAIGGVAGVAQVSVSLADKQATIWYDNTQTQIDTLKEVVEDAGFDVV